MKQQDCNTCGTEYGINQYPKLSTCATQPCSATCKPCWRKYLRINLIQEPLAASKVRCFDCGVPIDIEEGIRKGLLQGLDLEHYRYLKSYHQRIANGERACLNANCIGPNSLQPHDSTIDGRIFTCNACENQDCVPCNVKEHFHESCQQFQARMAQDPNEEATARYISSTSSLNIGRITKCPGCEVWIELIEGCKKIHSVTELGSAAHSCGSADALVPPRHTGSREQKRLVAAKNDAKWEKKFGKHAGDYFV